MFNMDILCQSSLMGTTLCAAPSKSYDFSTNDHAFIAMHTWCGWAPPIFCRNLHLWPFVYQLFSSSSRSDGQHSAKAMTVQQIIMHVLQFPHDVDVHLLFCVDISLHLTCSQGQCLILTDGCHLATAMPF